MKRITPSWSEFFSHSRIVTIQLQRNAQGELQIVTVDGLTAQGTSRILRLVPNAGGTPIDHLEAAIEVLASQIRQEIEGPPPLFG
jgi:hypothetical protein